MPSWMHLTGLNEDLIFSMNKMDLMDAIMARRPIEPLLEHGADVNEIRNGYTPLIAAAGNGDT